MAYQARNEGGPFDFVCDAEADLATITHPKVGQFALCLSEGTIHFHTGTAWQEISDISGHLAAADPHTGYRLESADHTHATTGLQGGQISHDSALTGVSANDHHNQSHTDSDHTELRTRRDYLLPTGAFSATVDRGTTNLANTAILSTGVLRMDAIGLQAGDVVTSIGFVSGTTAYTRGTDAGTSHIWAALYDSSLALIAQSTDDTAGTWAANSTKLFTLASPAPYTVVTSGLFYVALMVEIGTGGSPALPSMMAFTITSNAAHMATPKVSGTSDTGLTTTAPNPATALTNVSNRLWAYVK